MRATLFAERLECATAPLHAVLVLRDEPHPFALLGAWGGGGAVLGSRPVRVAHPSEDLFGLLDEQPALAGGDRVAGAIGGGWFGFLGFRLGARLERLDPPAPARSPLPAGALAFYDHVLRQDRAGRWWFEALITPERRDAILARRDELARRLASPGQARPFATSGWSATPAPRGHAALVQACRERIRAGDLFQANVCLRLDGQLDGDPLDVFACAATRLPTDRAAFLAGPWGALVSLSPELFLARRGARVRSAPIKGTRPVGRRAELVSSEKDRAENVMIVDLMRNDLGRVCTPGTIRPTALAEVRPHAGVWHMVSEVEGTLRPGVGDAELVRATFPPGSVTGAPKIAALNVISELESTRREAYTGAIGFASPAAGLELSVAIRTFEISGSRIWLGAGGGIVADSDPEHEAAEALAKAAPVLAAIDAQLEPGAATAEPAPLLARRGPRPLPRPDPAGGVYETLRVTHGRAERLDAHLARLAASVRQLYDAGLPVDLAWRVQQAAAGTADGRLRIDVVPGEDPAIVLTPRAPAPEPVLRPVVLPGGLGAHKWRDRRLAEGHEADDPATLPLFVDADGNVLETSRTGVVARSAAGELYTPPCDGSILPSVTVAAYAVSARALTLADLRAAPRLYVASALRGLQPASLAAGGV